MSQMFTLRDKLQLMVRIMKQEPIYWHKHTNDAVKKKAYQYQVWRENFTDLEDRNHKILEKRKKYKVAFYSRKQ